MVESVTIISGPPRTLSPEEVMAERVVELYEKYKRLDQAPKKYEYKVERFYNCMDDGKLNWLAKDGWRVINIHWQKATADEVAVITLERLLPLPPSP